MKLFLILLTTIACIFGTTLEAQAATNVKTSKKTESLEYDVYYHWGFIWKKAGRGSLNLYEETTADGSKRMHGQVVGRSLSFIEYIMAVRDTLDCWYSPEYVPYEFCKKTHEGSYKAIEHNVYLPKFNDKGSSSDDVESTTVNINRWRNKKGNDSKSYTVSGAAYDMLSIFYRVRSLNYASMKPGATFSFPVFAGIKKQDLKVRYVGEDTCKLNNGTKHKTYKVELRFNVKGEDGAPLYVWLSKDASHRPLCVVIQLKRVGSIQCEIAK